MEHKLRPRVFSFCLFLFSSFRAFKTGIGEQEKVNYNSVCVREEQIDANFTVAEGPYGRPDLVPRLPMIRLRFEHQRTRLLYPLIIEHRPSYTHITSPSQGQAFNDYPRSTSLNISER